MQDIFTSNMAHLYVTALEEVFEMWLITCALWPTRSPDLNLYYCLWQTLENIVRVNYPVFAGFERQY